MAGIKGRSGRRDHSTGEKAGRKIKGELPRDKKLFGYRYTEEEVKLIEEILEVAKKEYKTTSKSILEIFKFYKENMNIK